MAERDTAGPRATASCDGLPDCYICREEVKVRMIEVLRGSEAPYGFQVPCGYLVHEVGTKYSEKTTVCFQTDWDFPGLASTFGWAPCHSSTDGTIDCPECGKTAGSMIQEAREWLDDGPEPVEDPGYLREEVGRE